MMKGAMAIGVKTVALVMYAVSALIVLISIVLFFFAPWLALVTFLVAWGVAALAEPMGRYVATKKEMENDRSQ